MKVLLTQDVEKLGWLGDIVEVKTGYARNYLLPQGVAIIPTEANIKALADEKANRAEQRLEEKKRIVAAAEAVNGAEVSLLARANEIGHLFGSIGPHDIAENLRSQGFHVADEVVQLPEHIKEVGTHQVALRYRMPAENGTVADTFAEVSVTVRAEGQEDQGQKAENEEEAQTQ